jgi:hypothetical protein
VHRFGAICPARRFGAAIIMPDVNTVAMNEHLAEISTQSKAWIPIASRLNVGPRTHRVTTRIEAPEAGTVQRILVAEEAIVEEEQTSSC